MNNQKISIYPLSIMGIFFLLLANSCEKDNNNDSSGNSTNGKTTAVFNPYVTYGTLTDQDGNVYKTVIIGTQTWMAENLRTTKYNDGVDIPNVTDKDLWVDLTTGAYCNYNNTTDILTVATYGRLYNWYAVNTQLLAPTGWHVPTIEDFETLNLYLNSNAGGKLKEIETIHWNSSNSGVTNESGFTALPSGMFSNGYFGAMGSLGNWWSTTEINTSDEVWIMQLLDITNGSSKIPYPKQPGLSVRCIKD